MASYRTEVPFYKASWGDSMITKDEGCTFVPGKGLVNCHLWFLWVTATSVSVPQVA
jgi:uncharacterized protein YukJ